MAQAMGSTAGSSLSVCQPLLTLAGYALLSVSSTVVRGASLQWDRRSASLAERR